jgi:hypothetical protein
MPVEDEARTQTMAHSETVHDMGGEAANRDSPWLKMYAVRQMKRFSRSAGKAALGEYVDDVFDPKGRWALDIPEAVPLLISGGIVIFMTHR